MLILPELTLVTGGAASGKSAYSERLVRASGLQKFYFATAQIWDDEMAKKAKSHQRSRGDDWETVETGTDLAQALREAPSGKVILIDCITMWLTAHLMAEADLETATADLQDALVACPSSVVAVTNEIGQGVVPDTKMGRLFRNAHGRANQSLARQASSVIAVMSGLPFPLKGSLPKVPE